MKEIRDILRAYERAEQAGKRAALATVVHVEGSSYRRPGARMLITEDGELTGAISGGCLEGDALRKAQFAILQQENKLVTYDTTDEDDTQFGVQLGCNGIVHILFEPIKENSAQHPVRLLRELSGKRRDAVLLTLFSLDRSAEQPGTCLLFADRMIFSSLPQGWQTDVMKDVNETFEKRTSAIGEYFENNKRFQGFVEFVPPPPALVIAGAGNDTLPLVDLTAMLGWHTTVVDGRAQYATLRRFAKADGVLVTRPENVLKQLATDPRTLFLLMTHNYNYDLALLRELIGKEFGYIGILGPKKKLERMLAELQKEGIPLTDSQREAIHSPVGLDIGAETAEEIALSIVSEIKMHLSGTGGGPLKEKRDSIHGRSAAFSSHE